MASKLTWADLLIDPPELDPGLLETQVLARLFPRVRLLD